MERSTLETLADFCISVAFRLQELRPAGFSDEDIVKLKATAALLYEFQRIARN